MELTDDDINKLEKYIEDITYGKDKVNQQCLLLEALLEHKTLAKIPTKIKEKINNIPKKRQSLNRKLEAKGYILEKITYKIKKIKKENIETLIHEINKVLSNHKNSSQINIKIFNSKINPPIQNLNEALKKLQNLNIDCKTEITTSIEKDDPMIDNLRNLKKNIKSDYLKKNIKILRLHTNISTNIKIFFVLISTKIEDILFLYDEKQYIANMVIKDELVKYLLDKYYSIGVNQHINIDKINQQLDNAEKNELITNISNSFEELKNYI